MPQSEIIKWHHSVLDVLFVVNLSNISNAVTL